MALTKVTGQVINSTTDLSVGVATVGGGTSTGDLYVVGVSTLVGDLTLNGNVTIGGTLTYEDVTNVDSVGLITARKGITVLGAGVTIAAGGLNVNAGIATFNDHVQIISDNKRLKFGAGDDLNLYSTGTNGWVYTPQSGADLYMGTNAGEVYIQTGTGGNDTGVKVNSGGSVDMYFNGSPKLATSNTGITVTGTVAATAYTGDGSGLSGISVGITTEVLVKSNGQTASLDLTKDDHKVTATGTVTIDVTGGTEAGSHTLRIVNSGIATVGFSTYFLFPSGGTPNLPTTSGAISLISFTVHRAGAVGVSTQLLSGASVNFS